MVLMLSATDRRHTLTFAMSGALVMIAQQVAGKATRDALFLSQFDVAHLPKVIIAAAVVSLLAVAAMSALLPRFGPRRVVPITFVVSAGLFVLQHLFLDHEPRLTAVVLYLHMTGLGAVIISGFWSLINERFDPHSAKRRIARIAAAAALGGVLGGLLAHSVVASIGLGSMLLTLAVLNLACAGAVIKVAPSSRAESQISAVRDRSGLSLIARSTYLRNMSLLLVLVAVAAALLDFALKAEAVAAFTTREHLVSFFATFYAAAGVVGFLLQSAVGPRVLERFGIAHALAALPVVVLAGGILGAMATRLATTVALRGAHAVLGNSLFRSSFELLYAPLSPFAKRATKPIIDVAADRVGDMLGGGAILLLLMAAPQIPSGVMLLLAAGASGAALVVVSRLHHGYVEQLAGTLRSGALPFEDQEVLDATTRRILAETTASAERLKVLERIKALRRDRERHRGQRPGPIFGGDGALDEAIAQDTSTPRSRGLDVPVTLSPIALASADLCSGDTARIRNVLTGDFMDARLVAHLIPLLDHPEVAEDARMELRWMVPRIIGQLTDALLDPDQPLTVRQRIPAVLEVSHNPRVIDGLLEGLQDGEFSVRYASARALARMRSRNAQLTLAKDVVYAAVRREISVENDAWQARSLGAAFDADFEQLGEPAQTQGSALSLHHVFTLLGLVLDRDALQLALQALSSENRTLRGTALEYLDNVLPDDLRRLLWRRLGLARPNPRRGNPRARPRAPTGGN